jgi:hypothetical protein
MPAAPYQPPKTIAAHPGVESCSCAREETMGEYRHDVFLKDGWCWSAGRNAGGQGLFLNTVADFLAANPVQRPAVSA